MKEEQVWVDRGDCVFEAVRSFASWFKVACGNQDLSRHTMPWDVRLRPGAPAGKHADAAAETESAGGRPKSAEFPSSGSVDSVVGRMPEEQNLRRAAALQSEGAIFLCWISEQSASSQSLITQLTNQDEPFVVSLAVLVYFYKKNIYIYIFIRKY